MATTPSSGLGNYGAFTYSDDELKKKLAAMQQQVAEKSSQAPKPTTPAPSAPPAIPEGFVPVDPKEENKYENIRFIGDPGSGKNYGTKKPLATLINPTGNRVIARTDTTPDKDFKSASDYFGQGYVLEKTQGVYEKDGQTKTFGTAVQAPKPPQAPKINAGTPVSFGGSAVLPTGYMKIPGSYSTTAAQQAAFGDIRIMGNLGEPGSYLYGKPKDESLLATMGREETKEEPTAPSTPTAFVTPSDPSLDPLLKGHLDQPTLSPEESRETINAREGAPDISAEEFMERLNQISLERGNQMRALEEAYLKSIEMGADETEAQAALDELIATQRNLQASKEMGINEIKKQPIAMPFLAGQSAAVERDAATKMGALSAQAEPLRARLAAAQAKRAAAMDVGKERLTFEKERYTREMAEMNPIVLDGNIVRYNPITKKFDVVYKGSKATSPVSVAPGSTLVDPSTGQVVYHNEKPEAASQTNDIKEYEYARSGGFKGSFQDWLKMSANLKEQASGGFKNETDLRKEFNSLDVVKQFTDMNRSFNAMKSAYSEALDKNRMSTDPNERNASKAAADQALVTLYNKMLDPSSVVREGEYARSFAGQSALAQIEGWVNRVRSGGAGLTDENRADMVRVADLLMQDAQNMYDQSAQFYGGIADSYGLDRNRVLMIAPSVSGQNASNISVTAQMLGEKYGVPAAEIEEIVQYRDPSTGRSFTIQEIQSFLEKRGKDNAPSVAPQPNGEGASGTRTQLRSMDDTYRAAQAIGQFESGGNYGAVGKPNSKGQRAYGKYQIMDFNIPSWTKEILGRSMTPQEFLRNPSAQDQVARAKIGQYVQRFGNLEDVASVWFSGKPAAGNNNKDVLGTSVPQYIRNVAAIYNRLSPNSYVATR